MERKYPKLRVPVVLAQEGASAFESMLAAADEYVTPAQEFGGFGRGGVAIELLEQELAKGRRAAEERRRLADERRKGNK